jgi:hypothetical protein
MTGKTRTRLKLGGALAVGLALGAFAQVMAEEDEQVPAISEESGQPDADELSADEGNMNDEELEESWMETPGEGTAEESTKR